MAIALTITDSQNGGTVSYSVTQTAVAFQTTVKIFYALFSGEKSVSTSLAASITINGSATQTGTFTLPVGGYLFTATAENSAQSHFSISNFCSSPVTLLGNPYDTYHFVIMRAIKEVISGLNFPGIGSTNIGIRKLPRFLPTQPTEQIPLPFCFISALGVEDYDNKVMDRDDPGFPTLVTFVNRSNQNNEEDGTILQWRHNAMQKLRHPRLVGAPLVIKSAILPDAIRIPEALLKNMEVSAFACRHYIRETRG